MGTCVASRGADGRDLARHCHPRGARRSRHRLGPRRCGQVSAQSVETYERGIGALDRSRSVPSQPRFRILPHEEAGRPHVGRRIDQAGGRRPLSARMSACLARAGWLLRAAASRRAQAPLQRAPVGRQRVRRQASPQAGEPRARRPRSWSDAGSAARDGVGCRRQARLAHARGRVPGTGGGGRSQGAIPVTGRSASPGDRHDGSRPVQRQARRSWRSALAAFFLSGGGGQSTRRRARRRPSAAEAAVGPRPPPRRSPRH